MRGSMRGGFGGRGQPAALGTGEERDGCEMRRTCSNSHISRRLRSVALAHRGLGSPVLVLRAPSSRWADHHVPVDVGTATAPGRRVPRHRGGERGCVRTEITPIRQCGPAAPPAVQFTFDKEVRTVSEDGSPPQLTAPGNNAPVQNTYASYVPLTAAANEKMPVLYTVLPAGPGEATNANTTLSKAPGFELGVVGASLYGPADGAMPIEMVE